jgi:hypothetical protein
MRYPSALIHPAALLATLALVAAGCASGDTVPTDDGTSTSSSGPTTNSGSGGGTTTSASGGGTTNGSGGAGGATSGTGGAGGAKNDCGNATLDPGEDCDGTELGTASCTTIGQGFVGGTLGCQADCTFDTTACTAAPNCGNGAIDTGEACDGTNLGGKTCASMGLGVGTLVCTAGCALDTSDCHVCGNNGLEGPELCDGGNLGGQTCITRGHDGGTLGCAANCLGFAENACTDCGDNLLESPEECDGTLLNGQTCVTRGFSGGTLSCSGTCTFNTSACTGQTCGNNVREGNEVCDGTALNGQTCASQGFANGGTLGCAANCMGFDTAACMGAACSDGIDNDGDGFTDYPSDPGCTSAADNDEALYATSCNGVGGPIYDITRAFAADVTVNGSTVGQPNAYFPTDLAPSSDCSSLSGPERVYFYRNFSNASPVYISTDYGITDYDSVLYIRQTQCNTNATEICNDDVFFIGSTSELALNMPVGDYFIIVDGYNGEAGNFTLTIDMP